MRISGRKCANKDALGPGTAIPRGGPGRQDAIASTHAPPAGRSPLHALRSARPTLLAPWFSPLPARVPSGSGCAGPFQRCRLSPQGVKGRAGRGCKSTCWLLRFPAPPPTHVRERQPQGWEFRTELRTRHIRILRWRPSSLTRRRTPNEALHCSRDPPTLRAHLTLLQSQHPRQLLRAAPLRARAPPLSHRARGRT